MLHATREIHVRGDIYPNLSRPVCGGLSTPYFKRDGYFIDRCVECRLSYRVCWFWQCT
jgi:hypothetical protein